MTGNVAHRLACCGSGGCVQRHLVGFGPLAGIARTAGKARKFQRRLFPHFPQFQHHRLALKCGAGDIQQAPSEESMTSKIHLYIDAGSATTPCRMKRARNRSTASRHVGFTPDCGTCDSERSEQTRWALSRRSSLPRLIELSAPSKPHDLSLVSNWAARRVASAGGVPCGAARPCQPTIADPRWTPQRSVPQADACDRIAVVSFLIGPRIGTQHPDEPSASLFVVSHPPESE